MVADRALIGNIIFASLSASFRSCQQNIFCLVSLLSCFLSPLHRIRDGVFLIEGVLIAMLTQRFFGK